MTYWPPPPRPSCLRKKRGKRRKEITQHCDVLAPSPPSLPIFPGCVWQIAPLARPNANNPGLLFASLHLGWEPLTERPPARNPSKKDQGGYLQNPKNWVRQPQNLGPIVSKDFPYMELWSPLQILCSLTVNFHTGLPNTYPLKDTHFHKQLRLKDIKAMACDSVWPTVGNWKWILLSRLG